MAKKLTILFVGLLIMVLTLSSFSQLSYITTVHASLIRGETDDTIADLVIGKPDFNTISAYSTTSTALALPHGVFINRNNPSDNKMYIYDAGNNRILGYDLEDCLSSNTDPLNCVPSIVLGQPDFTSSGCNGDSGFQNYPTFPTASASTLCGEDASILSVSEGGSGASMAVDSSNNLFVADFANNRVLEYYDPFNTDTTADEVWGQGDGTQGGMNFTTSLCNKGLATPSNSSLCFSWGESNNWTAGVDVDSNGNLWIVDSANNRVLKFPCSSGSGSSCTKSKTASLVLGQTGFTTKTSGTGLNKMHDPNTVRVTTSGDVFVAEHFVDNYRVMKYSNPSTNGASGIVFGSGFLFPSGLDFDDTEPGRIWITNQGHSVIELWDTSGSGTLIRRVGDYNDGNLLGDVSGSIGVDSNGNLYAATGTGVSNNDVLIFNKGDDNTTYSHRLYTPTSYGNYVDENSMASVSGVVVTDNQVISADSGRILFWNTPDGVSDLSDGKPADGYVGAPDFNTLEPQCCFGLKKDNSNHLYTLVNTAGDDLYHIDVYDLPLNSGDLPSHQIYLPINLLGGGQISYTDAFHSFSGLVPAPDASYMWVSVASESRVFRIRDPLGASPTIDVILGQINSTGTSCNRGGSKGTTTLCYPGSLSLDNYGNFYLSDHSLEIQGNFRLLEYNAGTFPTNNSSIIYATAPSKIIDSVATWEPAFDAYNRMVVGYNAYYVPGGSPAGFGRFPAVYYDPLASNPTPDTFLSDYYSMALGATFDSDNNLYVTDLNRGRVMIYLQPFGPPNPILTEVTPVPTPGSDTTPSYTFSTTSAGTIAYGGTCSSSTSSAVAGNNTITFDELSNGTYSNCTITLTDSSSHVSNILDISPFTITDPPFLTEVTPVTTPTIDTTPNYTFNTTLGGLIVYDGDCSSNTTSASTGNNTITFNTLSVSTHSNCKIVVVDVTMNESNSLNVTPFTIITAPTLTQVTAVPSITTDTTPNYTFSASKAGTLTYGGSCSSSTTSVSGAGNKTITFHELNLGTYSNCTITLTDSNSFVSNALNVSTFTVTFKPFGDFNSDRKVDLSDFSILATYWNQHKSTADANYDGVVDLSDLSILASHWQDTF